MIKNKLRKIGDKVWWLGDYQCTKDQCLDVVVMMVMWLIVIVHNLS